MKIQITNVVAMGNNFVIGNNGTLPAWRLSDDMKHFKEVTIGSAVIMGRKTFESFHEKFRPLPQRDNFIISRDEQYTPSPTNDRTFVCTSLLSALHRAAEMHMQRIFIIGGGEIYRSAAELEVVRNMIVTHVEGEFEGDTFFPSTDFSKWDKETLYTYSKNERNSHSFSIIEYTKK